MASFVLPKSEGVQLKHLNGAAQSYVFQIRSKSSGAEICSHCGKKKRRMNRAAASKVTAIRGGPKQPPEAAKAAKKAKPSEKNAVRSQGDTQAAPEAHKPKASDFLKPSLVRENERITSASQYKWAQLSSPLSLKEARFKSSKEKIAAANSKKIRAAGKACSGHYQSASASGESKDPKAQYRPSPNDTGLQKKCLRQRMKQNMGSRARVRRDQDQNRRHINTPQEAPMHDLDQSRRQWRRYQEELAHFQALVKHMVTECMDACSRFGIQGSLPRHLDLHENASYAAIIESLLNECDTLCSKQEHELWNYQRENRTRSRCPLPEPSILHHSRHAYHTKQCQHVTGASFHAQCTCNSNTSDLYCCCLE